MANKNTKTPFTLHRFQTKTVLFCFVHEDSGQAAFNFQLVTDAEVEKIIKSLPSNKAPSIDKVSAKILKYSLPATLPILTSIFNNSFAACTFPGAWKISEITPILISGDFDDPNNTRPISPAVANIIKSLRETSTQAICKLLEL